MFLDKRFRLSEKNTNLKTEFIAGFTTFLTMLYIVPVNALILSSTGMPFEALITATALITIISTILNGIYSNTPIAMSVGMGINAYFAYGLVGGMGVSWQSGLGIVFISGLIFFVLTLTPFKRVITNSVPIDIKRAISASIGMFLAFIGLKQMGIIVSNPATIVSLGDFTKIDTLIGVIGILIVFGLYVLRVKGSFIISIIITSIIALFLNVWTLPNNPFSIPASIAPIALELDISSILSLSFLPVIIIFMITDLFDSVGTLSGIGHRAKIEDKDIEKTLQVDAFATMAGSVLGVSTTTSFMESASGVEEGGRTGLTAVFTGLFFISTLFLLPIFQAIPPNAIYPVLIMVGAFMFSEVTQIDFSDKAIASSTFVMILIMPLSFSITYGIASGFLVYGFLSIINREFNKLNLGLFILLIISLIAFIYKS